MDTGKRVLPVTEVEELAEHVGDALALIGVNDTSWGEDCKVAEALLSAGYGKV
jgi:hypothetical protein